MKKSEKVKRIHELLDHFYPEPPIPLLHRDPFTLLVAVLLSAQTTDAQVNRVSPELFRQAPDPASMANLAPEKILSLIRTCGLAPTKAKNVHQLAIRLVDEFDSKVPQNLNDLESLPGVGHKTASVVMAQAFGIPSFPVDTHIHRLAARWGLSNGRNVVQTEKDLKRLFPQSSWNKLHLQIIYFGREYCPARNHDLTTCPICSWAASQRRIRSEMG